MIGTSRAIRLDKVRLQVILTAALLFIVVGCMRIDVPAANTSSSTTLRIAYGLGNSQAADAGFAQTCVLIAEETLFGSTKEGRPQARLAESWEASPDGLLLKVRLRAGAAFDDGQPANAEAVKRVLDRQLPGVLRAAYSDIQEIRVTALLNLEIILRRRSRFLLEALADVPIEGVELVGKLPNGTGPFKVTQASP